MENLEASRAKGSIKKMLLGDGEGGGKGSGVFS